VLNNSRVFLVIVVVIKFLRELRVERHRFTRIMANFTNYTNFFYPIFNFIKKDHNVLAYFLKKIRVIRTIRYNSCKKCPFKSFIVL
jgi:hypothetical protein